MQNPEGKEMETEMDRGILSVGCSGCLASRHLTGCYNMSYSLNSLKGVYRGDYIEFRKG